MTVIGPLPDLAAEPRPLERGSPTAADAVAFGHALAQALAGAAAAVRTPGGDAEPPAPADGDLTLVTEAADPPRAPAEDHDADPAPPTSDERSSLNAAGSRRPTTPHATGRTVPVPVPPEGGALPPHPEDGRPSEGEAAAMAPAGAPATQGAPRALPQDVPRPPDAPARIDAGGWSETVRASGAERPAMPVPGDTAGRRAGAPEGVQHGTTTDGSGAPAVPVADDLLRVAQALVVQGFIAPTPTPTATPAPRDVPTLDLPERAVEGVEPPEVTPPRRSGTRADGTGRSPFAPTALPDASPVLEDLPVRLAAPDARMQGEAAVRLPTDAATLVRDARVRLGDAQVRPIDAPPVRVQELVAGDGHTRMATDAASAAPLDADLENRVTMSWPRHPAPTAPDGGDRDYDAADRLVDLAAAAIGRRAPAPEHREALARPVVGTTAVPSGRVEPEAPRTDARRRARAERPTTAPEVGERPAASPAVAPAAGIGVQPSTIGAPVAAGAMPARPAAAGAMEPPVPPVVARVDRVTLQVGEGPDATQVRVTVRGDVVSARITTGDAPGAARLAAAGGELTNALAEKGYREARVAIAGSPIGPTVPATSEGASGREPQDQRPGARDHERPAPDHDRGERRHDRRPPRPFTFLEDTP